MKKLFKKVADGMFFVLDFLAMLPHIVLLSDISWNPDKSNPVSYGLSVLIGLIMFCVASVTCLVCIAVVIGIIVQHPVVVGSTCVILGLFVLIGFLRKRFGR